MPRRYANPEDVAAVRRLFGRGLSNVEIARRTGVSVTSVRRWRFRPMAWPRSAGNPCPRCDERPLDDVAYAYLLGLYLGDGYIVEMKPGTYRLDLYLDARYQNIILQARQAIASVRGGGCRPALRDRPGAVDIYAYWNHWPCLFPQHGPGRKHERRILLASWQEAIASKHPRALLRGLIHSDGCRVINRVKGYEYPRYFFSNRSDDIRGIFVEGCARLGIEARHTNLFDVAVSRREFVTLLDTFIGPKS